MIKFIFNYFGIGFYRLNLFFDFFDFGDFYEFVNRIDFFVNKYLNLFGG